MILLDTNVISELIRSDADARVIAWLDTQQAEEIATSAITAAELLYGVRRLPDGKRRRTLQASIDAMLENELRGRVEPFDLNAAREYAEIVTSREAAGRPIAMADAQIAAICRSIGANLATRNTTDFDATGVDTLNPWQVC